MKNKVGNNISMVTSGWSFNSIEKKFDKHILKSVPFYNQFHEISLKLSEFFITDDAKILDIGCSTGTFLIDLSKKYPKKNYKINFLGIDPVSSMIKNAKSKNKDSRIKFLKKSIFDLKKKNYTFISAILTLQFISPSQRQKAYTIIYKSLNVGGGLIIFEKVRAAHSKNEEINVGAYNDFKRSNGFSEKEINQKALSLRGKMECYTPEENTKLLKNAGFSKIFRIFKWFGFEGVLCIK
tara:strand:+ start:289 stop:1002 length:714 start_codon:yes stop_codon:yes gene_type:complete